MTEKPFKIIGDSNVEFLMQSKLLLPIYYKGVRLNLKSCCDLLNGQEKTIQEYKYLVKIATSLIDWNTIPQIRREWQKHLSKVGDVDD